MAETNPTPPPTTIVLDGLLARWRNGDPAAREELLSHSYERVVDAVRRQLNFKFLDLKEQHDLHTREVQEKVEDKIRDWVRKEHVTPPETVRAYFAAVRTIIRRTLIDFARHFNAPGSGVRPLDVVAEPAYTPPAADDRAERAWWLAEALPTLEHEALELRYLAGLTLQEVSETLGLSGPAAAHRLIQKAEDALRKQFHPDNFDANPRGG